MLTWIDKEIETDPNTDHLLAVNANKYIALVDVVRIRPRVLTDHFLRGFKDEYVALLKASLPDGRNSAHDPCPCVEGQGMGPPC